MNKFNERYITTDNNYKRFVLTKQGEAYFRKYFPVTDNDTIAQNLGCSKRTVVKFAQTFGLKKDAAYISSCCRHAAKCVSQRDFEKFLAGGRKFHKTKKWQEMMQTIQEKVRRTRRMEYIRLLNGDSQRTRIRFREPYSAKRKWYRTAMKRRHGLQARRKAEVETSCRADTFSA